jgi:hypothetical protein
LSIHDGNSTGQGVDRRLQRLIGIAQLAFFAARPLLQLMGQA